MHEARSTHDAREALDRAGAFLARDPVANNVVLTLLGQRPEPGRYWWVTDLAADDAVVGFAMQSPSTLPALVASAPAEVLDALVDRMALEVPDLPGVSGVASVAAAFAGRWATTRRVPARPVEAERVHVLGPLVAPPTVPGSVRQAGADDVDVVARWMVAFGADTHMTTPSDPTAWARARVGADLVRLWDDGGPVSMAVLVGRAAGFARIGYVFTPANDRGHGYAAAVVAALADEVVSASDDRCLLVTQLSNPTANALYDRLGFEPVVEVLRYSFG